MFDFMNMAFNYEYRKVARFEKDKICIDTCFVTDSDQDYETGICHPKYNGGQWVIVEMYDTKEEAQIGHDKWVKKMTANNLPKLLKDVSTSEISKLYKGLKGE